MHRNGVWPLRPPGYGGDLWGLWGVTVSTQRIDSRVLPGSIDKRVRMAIVQNQHYEIYDLIIRIRADGVD